MSEVEDKLRRAIWDMMNFANMFVLVLDGKMIVKFANYSLYMALGFTDHHDILGKCWLDFIKEEDSRPVKAIHHAIASNSEDAPQFNEYRNDIVPIKGEPFSVKWFNAHINTDYNWSFSIGLRSARPVMITEDSVRAYYNQVISNDRTMILSLRNSILGDLEEEDADACEPELT
jgi:hypothetical protein